MVTMLTLWTATLLPDIQAARESRMDVLPKRLLHELKTHGCAMDADGQFKMFVNRVEGTKLVGVVFAGSRSTDEPGSYNVTMRALRSEVIVGHDRQLLMPVQGAEIVSRDPGGGLSTLRIQQGVLPFHVPPGFALLKRPLPSVTTVPYQPNDAPSNEKELRRLVSQLASASYRERMAAEKQLVEMGEQALPILNKIETLKDLEAETRLRRIRQKLTKYETIASFESKVRFVPDVITKTKLPGLVGQVRLRGQGFATCDDVQIIVDLYATPAKDQVVPEERWIIGPGTLSKTAKKHGAGLDCDLFLPLATYKADARKVKICVRVESTSPPQSEPALRVSRPPPVNAPSGAILSEAVIEVELAKGE
jgi:hypothetical protein